MSFRVPELILQRAEQRAEVEQVSLLMVSRRGAGRIKTFLGERYRRIDCGLIRK